MWTKNGRKLIFSSLIKCVEICGEILMRDSEACQQGREWLVITKTSRGSGTMWLGTGKMSANQYRGLLLIVKLDLLLCSAKKRKNS